MKFRGFLFERIGCKIDYYIYFCSKCPHQNDEDGCKNKRNKEEMEPIFMMGEGRDIE